MGVWSHEFEYAFVMGTGATWRMTFSRRLSQAEYDYLAEAVREGRWAEVRMYSKLVEASAR